MDRDVPQPRARTALDGVPDAADLLAVLVNRIGARDDQAKAYCGGVHWLLQCKPCDWEVHTSVAVLY